MNEITDNFNIDKHWVFHNEFDEYIDFETVLFKFKDELQTAVVMRLTFVTNTHTAYAVIYKEDDYHHPQEPHIGSIQLTWEAALQLLKATPKVKSDCWCSP